MNVEIEVEVNYGVNNTFHLTNVKEVKRGNSHFTLTFENGEVIIYRNNLVRFITYVEQPGKESTKDYKKIIKETIQLIDNCQSEIIDCSSCLDAVYRKLKGAI